MNLVSRYYKKSTNEFKLQNSLNVKTQSMKVKLMRIVLLNRYEV